MLPYLAIVQARMGSSRLPGKVMADLCSKPIIWHVIERLRLSKTVGRIVVAIPTGEKDDVLFAYLHEIGAEVFRGSETDVLGRFCQASRAHPSHAVVRVTADNPLFDPKVLDETVQYFEKGGYRYARTEGFPLGVGAEVFTASLLEEANGRALTAFEREHVTPYMYTSQGSRGAYDCGKNRSRIRLTVDTEEDFLFMQKIYKHFFRGFHNFFLDDILAYLGEEI
ncbi:cytidylyltransferase domain-containing protein [Caproicibacter sp.]|uniref:cytidylyltransferase domain-containing protein n=1 Tax=Caproicibacter sp. TaxID=2814884 RepID=UPI003989DDA5